MVNCGGTVLKEGEKHMHDALVIQFAYTAARGSFMI